MPGAVRAFAGAVGAVGAVRATIVLGPVRSAPAVSATVPAVAPPESVIVAAVSGTAALPTAISAAFTPSVPAALPAAAESSPASAAAGAFTVPCQQHLPPEPQKKELGADVEHDCLLAR
ncbi:hypothetical protein ABZY45_30680 [Streptomyces sp. NPDC006516]|uniref:hypothetical protein n=1 Tax=Streptomyces sp. NPDC006516 TaxID=3154309 RepID=UPI0033B00030